MLAPIENYSDSALRTLCFNHGADLTFTEMTRVEGIIRNNKPTLAKILCCDSTPVEIQLLASNEEQLEKFVSSFKPFEGFRGFNLNMSCPSKELIKVGRGAGMVKRLTKAQNLVKIIQKYNYPVSIKMRLGANAFEQKHKVYLRLIEGSGADYYIVHPKHGSQNSDEEVQGNQIYEECLDSAKISGSKIIANGGITTPKKVIELKKIGVSGVMIARAALKNPSIFDYLKNEAGFNTPIKKIPSIKELKEEYTQLSNKFSSPHKYKENLSKLMKN
ncbi:MAG: tRNA-dihydrouridine synthase A [archaeon ADurb.Bin336]|nr:MAG: tRNA-dihydrouridine synthase A [archaeon ADurb.Bin336]